MRENADSLLKEFLTIKYPYTVIEDEGEFFISFPDLPGCMTQVENAQDIHSSSQEIKDLWIETSLESGHKVPEGPAQEFSGKFMVRIPKSLHRDLTYQAREEGMSLNAFILHLLSDRSSLARLDTLISMMEPRLTSSEVSQVQENPPRVLRMADYWQGPVSISGKGKTIARRRENQIQITLEYSSKHHQFSWMTG